MYPGLLKQNRTFRQRSAFRKIVRKLRKSAICIAHFAFFSALAQFALRSMPFFQRLRNLRLRIGKSLFCCALIVNFFPRCAITK